ncbi:MAG: Ig-like domain-containing protein, partial [Acidobacteriaceae bacterium]|nr:Ig-like domain-containing protein [Acidobacteriaceae bacterium]
IDQNGLFTVSGPLAFLPSSLPATVVVTATTTDGSNKTATAIVTVTAQVAVTGVTVTPATASVALGGSVQLTATVLPANATDTSVTWSSDYSGSGVSVDQTGRVSVLPATAFKPAGTIKVTITATTNSGGKTATSIITVN